jgi:multiple sugar transport system permease protein
MTGHRNRLSPEHKGVKLLPLGPVLSYAALAGWACICLFPLYWTAATSLKGPLEVISGPYYAPFIDYTPSLDAWAYILSDVNDAPLLRYFNSVVVGLMSTALTVGLAGLAVYGLTRFRHTVSWPAIALIIAAATFAGSAIFAGSAGFRVVWVLAAALSIPAAIRSRRYGRAALPGSAIMASMLASRILPPVVIVLPIYLMAQQTGMLDTRFALIATYTAANLPVAVWLLQPVLGEVATDLEEAAQLDGASRFRILFEVVAPVAARGFIATGFLVFVLCWNEYLFSVYLADNRAMTMPPYLAAQMSVREQQANSDAEEWTRLSAAILLMTAPLILGTGFLHRLIARSALGRESSG